MKNLLTAAALIALTATASAQTKLTPTQDYRMWSAEQYIKRITERAARATAICKQLNSQACQELVIRTYPILAGIRDVAANGDEVEWTRLVDAIHMVEDTDKTLNR